MRKPAFCICKNKEADQLRGIFATRIVQSLYFLNPKLHASSHLLWLYSWFVSDLVGNPEDQFFHNEAHMIRNDQELVGSEQRPCPLNQMGN